MYILNIGGSIIYLKKTKSWHQKKLAKQLTTSVSVISRYEIIPSIDTAKKLASILGTTVRYLLGENQYADMFKNQDMLQRFADILSFPKDKQEHILFAIDSMIKAIKLEKI